MQGGRLRGSMIFEKYTETRDEYGGISADWSEFFRTRVSEDYAHGKEAVQAGALAGTASWKVRLRAQAKAKQLTAKHRMKDARDGTLFQIREVDARSDPRWIYLVVESGVAV